MANYNVKLNVDTSQHDRAMEKSAGQVNYYAKRVMDAKDKVAGLTKKIPALALAVGGMTVAWKGAKAVMESVDSLGDDLGRTMDTGKAVVDSFVTSLATANFSSFIMGLQGVISSAKEAFDSLDKLNTFTLESSIPLADIKAEIAEYRAIIGDKNASMDKRIEARKKISTLEEPLSGIYDAQIENAIEVFIDKYNAKLGGILSTKNLQNMGIKTEEINTIGIMKEVMNALRDRYIPGNNESNWQASVDVIEKYFNNLRAELLTKQQQVINKHPVGSAQRESATMAYNKMLNAFKTVFADIEKMRDVREDEDGTDLTKSEILHYFQLAIDTGRLKEEDLKIIRKAAGQNLTELVTPGSGKGTKTETVDKVELEAQTGSLKSLEKELKTLQTDLDAATYTNDIAKIKDLVQRIENKETEISEKKQELGIIKPQLPEVNIPEGPTLSAEEYDKLIENVNNLKSQLDGSFITIFDGVMNVSGAFTSLGQTMGDVFNSEEVTEFFGAMQEGLNVLNTFYQTYQAIAGIIEVVNTLKETSTALDQAQTAANAASTASSLAKTSADSGAAIAGATKSGAGIPFPYNLIAIATGIAAVIGALSLIGKFATGGIVGGNTTMGDMTLARVNKGEMILNQREQSRLFNILSGIDSVNTGSMTGDVKFRISGGDLIGVLNNQSKKRSRVL